GRAPRSGRGGGRGRTGAASSTCRSASRGCVLWRARVGPWSAPRPLLAQQRLLHLPRRGRARERVEEANDARLLVAGEVGAYVLHHVLLADGRARAPHDRGGHDLAPVGVGHAEHAASAIPGWSRRQRSTSAGKTFSPPLLIISLRRPAMCRKPSSSNAPRSPVWSQPPRSACAVASGIRQ